MIWFSKTPNVSRLVCWQKEYLIIIVISPKYYETVTAAPVSLQHDEQTLATVYIHKQVCTAVRRSPARSARVVGLLYIWVGQLLFVCVCVL